MAPIIYELKKQEIDFEVCVTAQHREMLDQVLGFFEIAPDYDLNLMNPGQNLNSLSAHILRDLDRVLEDSNPDIIFVQGDTTTAFIAALSAFNRGIKIAHIEAGLRTGNLKSPFPEEGNRQLISRIVDLHFASTLSAKNNLLQEDISENKIIVTGNTVIDALFMAKSKLDKGYTDKVIKRLEGILLKDRKIILVTGHRRENFGKGLKEVCLSLLHIATRGDLQIVFPVHLNPKVKKTVFKLLGNNRNIHLIEPINYPTFIWLMLRADLIISDSGGIQEEAPSLKKPVIVTRETTERNEAVEMGFSVLTGTSQQKIISESFRILDAIPDYSEKSNPFGDGLASIQIIKYLIANYA